MNPLKMQPTFAMHVPLEKDQAVSRLKTAIASHDLQGHAVAAGTVFDFKIDRAERRFWSPHLSIQLSEADSGTQLFARYSPRPEIWTMFIAMYFVVAIGMAFASLVGCSQWLLGFAPWALAAIPVGVILIVGLHVASLIGQGLSSDQMELLRGRFDRAVEIAFDKTTAGESPACEPTQSSEPGQSSEPAQ